jgi:hypothetical protein
MRSQYQFSLSAVEVRLVIRALTQFAETHVRLKEGHAAADLISTLLHQGQRSALAEVEVLSDEMQKAQKLLEMLKALEPDGGPI